MDKTLLISIFAYGIYGIYILALILVLLYSLSQIQMLFYYRRFKKQKIEMPGPLNEDALPKVTIQLPLYNERYVVERLLKSITSLDYPKEKLQIQVLDDSDEEDQEITEKLVIHFQSAGHPIEYHHRKNRSGFKAGALRAGLKKATGAYVAIFDADFIPPKNWLRAVLPHFNSPQTGAVQTRWGHLNRNYSIFTWAQSLALDIHFRLEQTGRSLQQHFINFNGTGGVWRKTCIETAGNWEGDTLTEDLDLSYRAQLNHWKIKYIEAIECPAELPVMLSGIRSQQFRWNKGGAENFRKHIKKVWNSNHLARDKKVFATLHLLNSSLFLIAFLLLFLSVPMFWIQKKIFLFEGSALLLAFFSISTLFFMRCYWEVHQQDFGKSEGAFWEFLQRFFLFYALAMGFSFHNSWAVLEGLIGVKSAFIRTPKFNIRSTQDQWKGKAYSQKKRLFFTWFEGALTLYFLVGCYLFWRWGTVQDLGFLLLFLIAAFGFGTLVWKSVKEWIS